MNLVITMAGLGSRFLRAGYQMPKYMIQAREKSLLEWSLESLEGLKGPENRYFFIVRKEEQAQRFINEVCDKLGIYNRKIIEIDHVTRGQAETAMMAQPYWDRGDS